MLGYLGVGEEGHEGGCAFHEGFACGVAGLAVEALALFGCAYPEESVGAEVEVGFRRH